MIGLGRQHDFEESFVHALTQIRGFESVLAMDEDRHMRQSRRQKAVKPGFPVVGVDDVRALLHKEGCQLAHQSPIAPGFSLDDGKLDIIAQRISDLLVISTQRN